MHGFVAYMWICTKVSLIRIQAGAIYQLQPCNVQLKGHARSPGLRRDICLFSSSFLKMIPNMYSSLEGYLFVEISLME